MPARFSRPSAPSGREHDLEQRGAAGSRGGSSASTSCSNGRSWLAGAQCPLADLGQELDEAGVRKSVRRTSVLTKKPTRPSTSTRARLATGCRPRCLCAESRCSSAWNAASSVMNGRGAVRARQRGELAASSGGRSKPSRAAGGGPRAADGRSAARAAGGAGQLRAPVVELRLPSARPAAARAARPRSRRTGWAARAAARRAPRVKAA